MTRSVWKGPFVDGYLLKKADAARASTRNEVIKNLVSPFDDAAAVCRSDIRCAQRPQVYPGIGYRGNGWPQVRRICSDTYLLWSRCR